MVSADLVVLLSDIDGLWKQQGETDPYRASDNGGDRGRRRRGGV
jgi:hypothetical protein